MAFFLHRIPALEKQDVPLTEALVIYRAEVTAEYLISYIVCAHHIYSSVNYIGC